MNEVEIEIARWARKRDEDASADEAVLAASLAIQARRRVRRRGLGALALLLVIGAAFAAGRATAPRAGHRRSVRGSAAGRASAPRRRPRARALTAPLAERGELMLRAGDRWLEEGEVLASLRCYDELLRRPDGAEDDPTGASWLLYALRRDRN
ncbi:MAG: hypothetical protein R3F20_05380 [Planctomycetota bacterium]